MVWVNHGHTPCRSCTSKNPHGSQLLWAPTSQKIGVGGTCILSYCKHSSQYDRRHVERSRERVGTWNLYSVSAMGGEVGEELRKMMIDVCCLQEVIWRGQGARMMGKK